MSLVTLKVGVATYLVVFIGEKALRIGICFHIRLIVAGVDALVVYRSKFGPSIDLYG